MLSSVYDYECKQNEIVLYVPDTTTLDMLNRADHLSKLQEIAKQIGDYKIIVEYKKQEKKKDIVDLLQEKFKNIIIK